MSLPVPSTEQLYAKNRQILEHIAKTLKDVNKGYQQSCDKLTKWLADDRAFYERVQPLIVECLEVCPEPKQLVGISNNLATCHLQIAGRSLMDVCVISRSGPLVLNNIQCPPEYESHKSKFLDLAAAVRRRSHRFVNKGLQERLKNLFKVVDDMERLVSGTVETSLHSLTMGRRASADLSHTSASVTASNENDVIPMALPKTTDLTEVLKLKPEVIDLTCDSPPPMTQSLPSTGEGQNGERPNKRWNVGFQSTSSLSPDNSATRKGTVNADSSTIGSNRRVERRVSNPHVPVKQQSSTSPLPQLMQSMDKKPDAAEQGGSISIDTTESLTSPHDFQPIHANVSDKQTRKSIGVPSVSGLSNDTPAPNTTKLLSEIPSAMQSHQVSSKAQGDVVLDAGATNSNDRAVTMVSISSQTNSTQHHMIENPTVSPMKPMRIPPRPSIPQPLDHYTQKDYPAGLVDISFYLNCNAASAGEQTLYFNITSHMERYLDNWISRRGDVALNHVRYLCVALGCFKSIDLSNWINRKTVHQPDFSWPSKEEGPVWGAVEGCTDCDICLAPPISSLGAPFVDMSDRVKPGGNALKIIHMKALTGYTFVLRIYEIPADERIKLTPTLKFPLENVLKSYLTLPP